MPLPLRYQSLANTVVCHPSGIKGYHSDRIIIIKSSNIIIISTIDILYPPISLILRFNGI
jgi:hypothetical protein